MLITINELDYVQLKNGKLGTIVDILKNGEAFLFEPEDKTIEQFDMIPIKVEDIEKVL